MLEIMSTRSSRLLPMMGVVLAFTLLPIQVTLCCVTPLETLDFWGTDEGGDDALGGSVAHRTRLRREVTLSERLLCEEGDTQPPNRVDTSDRVSQLQEGMRSRNLDAYIVPSQDEHQSEYVADADKRRSFISGFTGSAGTAIILATGQRALWTDGRYFLAADDLLDCHWLLMKSKQPGVPTMMEWLKEQLGPDSSVGFDSALISATTFAKFQDDLNDTSIRLAPEGTNLVDLVWPNKPPRSSSSIYVLEQQFVGKKWEEKVKEVREAMLEDKVDLMVVTALDEVAWLFNLRGDDVPYNPVFRSYVLLDRSKVTLFIDSGRITPEVDFHLRVSQCIEGLCLSVTAYDNFLPRLQTAAADATVKRVLLPKKYSYTGGASYAVMNAVPKGKRYSAVSPLLEMKARKNPVEFQGMKRSHLKDAVALVDFLAFLEKEIDAGNSWDEVTAAEKVEEFRSQQEHFMGPSFATISAFGPNGAIIHYKPTNLTNREITTDSLYLLDSGGQYKDGTTDVTRTLHYGSPTEYQKDTYTRVLMGAIDLATLVFPKGTGDASIDVLARRYLYSVGLDYKHGTGHGIGMFLNVHEPPTQIRIFSKENHKFELGQFFSDEPGYYKDGEFGIRLETILAVVEAETKYPSVKDFYKFEAITLVPFEPKLINLDMLNDEQCFYLNAYHALVLNQVGPIMEREGRLEGLSYLRQRTEPLSCGSSNGKGLMAGAAHASPATSGKARAPSGGPAPGDTASGAGAQSSYWSLQKNLGVAVHVMLLLCAAVVML